MHMILVLLFALGVVRGGTIIVGNACQGPVADGSYQYCQDAGTAGNCSAAGPVIETNIGDGYCCPTSPVGIVCVCDFDNADPDFRIYCNFSSSDATAGPDSGAQSSTASSLGDWGIFL